MKRIFAALLTFTIGVSGWSLLKPEIKEFRHEVYETPIFVTEDFSVKESLSEKNKDLEPFFDSFDSDSGYGGWFMADKFKGMPEVWTILLDRSYENSKNEKMIWSAMVLTQFPDYSSNDDDNFHSIQMKTVGNSLSFKTNKIRGIEYKFDGEFYVNGNSFPEGEKVLRGTMQKIVKGKRVAEFTADFAYQEPHCFH